MGHDDQFKIIEARCTRFALELLRESKDSPYLPQVLELLQGRPGSICRGDIEAAFLEILKKERG